MYVEDLTVNHVDRVPAEVEGYSEVSYMEGAFSVDGNEFSFVAGRDPRIHADFDVKFTDEATKETFIAREDGSGHGGDWYMSEKYPCDVLSTIVTELQSQLYDYAKNISNMLDFNDLDKINEQFRSEEHDETDKVFTAALDKVNARVDNFEKMDDGVFEVSGTIEICGKNSDFTVDFTPDSREEESLVNLSLEYYKGNGRFGEFAPEYAFDEGINEAINSQVQDAAYEAYGEYQRDEMIMSALNEKDSSNRSEPEKDTER